MIVQEELTRAQERPGNGQIWREWQEGFPGQATLQAIAPIVPDTYEGAEFDAVWMVLALQAHLPGRFRGGYNPAGPGEAAAVSHTPTRLRQVIGGARSGDRETVLRYLVEIAKAVHRSSDNPPVLSMKTWVQDTADALSGDPELVKAACQRWAVGYAQADLKRRGPASGQSTDEQEEMTDEHV